MHRTTAIVVCTALTALAAAIALNTRADDTTPEGFTRLFDGKTLKGWEGNLDWFRIQDGAIVAGSLQKPIPRNEFLCTEQTYGDFELRLKVKLVEGKGNAGVQIRTKRIPNHHEVSGYQADVGIGWWGSLYDESRRNRILAKADPKVVENALKPADWNDYIIRCEGKRIRLWLNGQQTVDYTEKDEGIDMSGIIAVQVHSGAAMEAWYKDIVLKKL
jgi:hypothetical protein